MSKPGDHIINGEFQSDKYPWCQPGFVPLKITDQMAQPVLWEYAQKRRAVDPAFAADLETALKTAGYDPVTPWWLVEFEDEAITFVGKYNITPGSKPGVFDFGPAYRLKVFCQALDEAGAQEMANAIRKEKMKAGLGARHTKGEDER